MAERSTLDLGGGGWRGLSVARFPGDEQQWPYRALRQHDRACLRVRKDTFAMGGGA